MERTRRATRKTSSPVYCEFDSADDSASSDAASMCETDDPPKKPPAKKKRFAPLHDYLSSLEEFPCHEKDLPSRETPRTALPHESPVPVTAGSPLPSPLLSPYTKEKSVETTEQPLVVQTEIGDKPKSKDNPNTVQEVMASYGTVDDAQECPVVAERFQQQGGLVTPATLLPYQRFQQQKELVTPATLLLLQQMQPWVLEAPDLHGGMRKYGEGHRGLRCSYCGSCKQFAGVENLGKNYNHILHHFISQCPACPSDIKGQLEAGKGTMGGNRRRYLNELWRWLHDLDESTVTATQKAARERFTRLAPRRKGASKAKKRAVILRPVAPPKIIPDVFLRLLDIPSKVDKYVEETAFLHHNQPFSTDKLATEEATDQDLPLPPPPPLPSYKDFDFPEGSLVKWSLFPDTRMVLANFTKVNWNDARSIADDVQCVRSLMERDDLTLILEGLYDGDYIPENLSSSNRWNHKFRRFKSDATGSEYTEESGYLALKTADFFNVYLKRNDEICAGKADLDPVVVLSKADGTEVSVDVRTDVLYMTDLNLPTSFPELNDKFRNNFRLPQLLPGGEWCSQFQVPVSARNEMGPNLYVCPPGGFTHFHQDGFGTVDSGHLNLRGYNEVVMTRRLPERHKRQVALDIQRGAEVFNATYSQPHSDSKKPPWPSEQIIAQWKERGYCPSVFVLKPGQFIHINKGRMHAFRKLGLQELPPDDCHAVLRKTLIREKKLTAAPVCVSIAWDWQFLGGASAEGTHRETMTMLEAQLILDSKNRNDPSRILLSLATPRTALLAIAMSLLSATGNRDGVIARGIRAPLLYVLRSELATYVEASKISREPHAVGQVQPNSVWVEKSSDQTKNPVVSQIDPDGVDYSCQLCYTELANCYFHCFGCEQLLGRDFNFCVDCFKSLKWAETKKMGPPGLDFSTNSLRDHVGDRPERYRSCMCSKKCKFCGRCYEHACICHTCSTLHCRYLDKSDLERLREDTSALEKVSVDCESIANARLAAAQDREGNGAVAKKEFLDSLIASGRSDASEIEIETSSQLADGIGLPERVGSYLIASGRSDASEIEIETSSQLADGIGQPERVGVDGECTGMAPTCAAVAESSGDREDGEPADADVSTGSVLEPSFVT